MIRRRRLGSALATMVVAGLAAGCAGDVVAGRAVTRQVTPSSGSAPTGSSSTGSSGPSGTVTFGEGTGEIGNLMPLISAGNSTANGNLQARVLDGLYRSAPNISYQPDPDQGSATSSTVGGQQVVDISINPNAVWADGAPITADDYAFTIAAQKSTDPGKGGCAALLSTSGYEQVARTEKISDKRLRVYFSTPFADWRGLFSGGSAPLLSRHVLDGGSPAATCARITQGWPVSGGIPLGAQNGPWLLTGDNVDVPGRTITLVPNPRYWGAKPKLATLVYKTIGSDADSSVTALQSGEVDIVYPQPQLDLTSKLKSVSGIRTEINYGSAFEHLDFNPRDPLLKYPQVRQAIALAIDRKAVVERTVGRFTDRAVPLGNRLLLASQPGYTDNSGQYANPNLARAKQLLAGVGAKPGSDGVLRIGGRPLSFRVMTTRDNPLRDVTVGVIAQQVRAIGVRLTEFANPDIFEGPDKPTSLAAGGFQLALFAWVGSPSLSSSSYIYSRTGAQNYGKTGTAAIDSALQGTVTASTPAAQVAAANTADRLLWQQMATLPLYQKPTLLAYRATIRGLGDNSTPAGPLWNSDQLTVR